MDHEFPKSHYVYPYGFTEFNVVIVHLRTTEEYIIIFGLSNLDQSLAVRVFAKPCKSDLGSRVHCITIVLVFLNFLKCN